MEASILAISTAVPSYALNQEKIADFFIDALSIRPEKADEIRQMHKNSKIRTRYSVLSDFGKSRSEWEFLGSEFPKKIPGMGKRNDIYKIEAPKLGMQAAKKALESWGRNREEITHVISVSCTGALAPGLEFSLMKSLNLKATTERFGINFMGCFGAFKGLLVAKAFAKENPNHRILLVCTELCSLHFQAEETADNMLGNSLFSDGAAAVIVGTHLKPDEKPLWQIKNTCSIGLDDTLDKITWEAGNEGFLMKLSHKIPVLLGRNIQSFSKSLLGVDFSHDEINWAVHPGGKSIIQAIEKKLDLREDQTRASWDVLENYGNMSSATFLFVLNQLLEQKSKKQWTAGVGFGPGLSIEGILLSS
ncbi:MAG TPA: type III polyketide synthase [Parachlamydiaceae bacterium]|nr:type III polyketide synthase [Parachlamydiaceae bacterium]